jgi:hypothetical protein
MSNYLENLIAKSFNRLEIARPRLASRFESLAQRTPQPASEVYAMAQTDVEAAPEHQAEAPEQNLAASKLRELRHMRTAKRLPEEPETSVWRGNQQPQGVEQTSPARQAFTPQSTVQNSAAQQSSPESPKAPDRSHKLPEANLQPAGPQPMQHRQEVLQEASGKAPGSPQELNLSREPIQSKADVIVPGPLQNAPLAIRRPVNEPQAEPHSKTAKVAYLPFARQADKDNVQPRAALRLEHQQAPEKLRRAFEKSGSQQAEPQAAPTINVTIGRIEVRATTPPAAQLRKPKPAAPTMSLEEYLRRRDRGGGK